MKDRLSPSTLRELASALESEREQIEACLRALAEAERALGASQAEEGAALGPPSDVASDLAEQELDFGLNEAAQSRMAEVQAALRRISEGRYGACELCGHGIDVARLRAVPRARLCIRCAGGASHPAEHHPGMSNAASTCG